MCFRAYRRQVFVGELAFAIDERQAFGAQLGGGVRLPAPVDMPVARAG